MKNILVPTDFSPVSEQACAYALKIAEQAKAEIHFLHIQYTPVEWVLLDKEKEKNFPETLKQIGLARHELKKWEKRAKSLGLPVKKFLIFDVGREEIIKHVSGYHHDFVIMGSHGASGVRETFMGSTAQKIIRHATAPVLVLKESIPDFPMKHIVFASDFEEDVMDYFRQVVDFADLMEAAIHLVYVNTPYNFEDTDISEKKMNQFLSHCPRGEACSVNVYNAKDEEEGIRKFAQSKQAGLIAITTHGSKGFLGLMSKSITESLVNHADIAVLSINIRTASSAPDKEN